jgi:hypothetical protein
MHLKTSHPLWTRDKWRGLLVIVALMFCEIQGQELRLNHNRYDLVVTPTFNGTTSYSNTTSVQRFGSDIGSNVTYVSGNLDCTFAQNPSILIYWCRIVLLDANNFQKYMNNIQSITIYVSDYVNSTVNSAGLSFSYDPTLDSTLDYPSYIEGDLYCVVEIFSFAIGPVVSQIGDIYFDVTFENLELYPNSGNVALNTFFVVLLFFGGYCMCIGCSGCIMCTVMCIVISGRISYFDRDINWNALFNKEENEMDYDNLPQNQL